MGDVTHLPPRAPVLSPAAPNERAAIAMAQADLVIAATHVVQRSTAFMHTGAAVDRDMALIGLRECRDVIQQFDALLAPHEPPHGAA